MTRTGPRRLSVSPPPTQRITASKILSCTLPNHRRGLETSASSRCHLEAPNGTWSLRLCAGRTLATSQSRLDPNQTAHKALRAVADPPHQITHHTPRSRRDQQFIGPQSPPPSRTQVRPRGTPFIEFGHTSSNGTHITTFQVSKPFRAHSQIRIQQMTYQCTRLRHRRPTTG